MMDNKVEELLVSVSRLWHFNPTRILVMRCLEGTATVGRSRSASTV